MSLFRRPPYRRQRLDWLYIRRKGKSTMRVMAIWLPRFDKSKGMIYGA